MSGLSASINDFKMGIESIKNDNANGFTCGSLSLGHTGEVWGYHVCGVFKRLNTHRAERMQCYGV